MRYVRNILIGLDQLCNVILGGDDVDETISSAVGRKAAEGRRWAIAIEALIDAWFALLFGERHHCANNTSYQRKEITMTKITWGTDLAPVNFELAQNVREGAEIPRGTPVRLMYKRSWWSNALSPYETEWGLIRQNPDIKKFAFQDTEVGRSATHAIGRWARGR